MCIDELRERDPYGETERFGVDRGRDAGGSSEEEEEGGRGRKSRSTSRGKKSSKKKEAELEVP